MKIKTVADFVNEVEIDAALRNAVRVDARQLLDCVQKAVALERLSLQEIAILMRAEGELREELLRAAYTVKQEIYGARVVFSAALYVSNLCANECSYCVFRKENRTAKRRCLSQQEIREQTRLLIEQGHTRVLLVAGEAYPRNDFHYVLDAIATIYATRSGESQVRRVSANLAPPTVEQFYQLREARLGVYQCFQESYHRPTYSAVHRGGKKADFDWRATVMDRAMASGIGDVGMGVLYGLYDWRWETLALVQHVRHLERQYGAGARTLSVPRLDSDATAKAPFAISDEDLLKIIAVLRLAVPYTGLTLSTREPVELRRKALEAGISQISTAARHASASQVEGDPHHAPAQDPRSLDEVVREVAELGFVPSFCTACYRVGRTGADFKNLASHPYIMARQCDSNALTTLLGYLCDHSASSRVAGEQLIELQLEKMPPTQRAFVTQMLDRIKRGERDVFV